MHWRGVLQEQSDLNQAHNPQTFSTAGHALGIIAVDLFYPKMPGNVANATTYPFPVLYKKVSFEIEALFRGDAAIADDIINAAQTLEKEGVRAIIGACGYFANFQRQVSEAVRVPVFLSSLCQLPLIKLGLQQSQKVAVFVASGEHATSRLFELAGADFDHCIVHDIGVLESFAPIRWGGALLDHAALTQSLGESAKELVNRHPDIGAILLECSDLPPYAYFIQQVTGLPVFDFNSLIHWVYYGIVQKRYFGYF